MFLLHRHHSRGIIDRRHYKGCHGFVCVDLPPVGRRMRNLNAECQKEYAGGNVGQRSLHEMAGHPPAIYTLAAGPILRCQNDIFPAGWNRFHP